MARRGNEALRVTAALKAAVRGSGAQDADAPGSLRAAAASPP
jgi:hypothetical protein